MAVQFRGQRWRVDYQEKSRVARGAFTGGGMGLPNTGVQRQGGELRRLNTSAVKHASILLADDTPS
jgi:hypothetical protein